MSNPPSRVRRVMCDYKTARNMTEEAHDPDVASDASELAGGWRRLHLDSMLAVRASKK